MLNGPELDAKAGVWGYLSHYRFQTTPLAIAVHDIPMLPVHGVCSRALWRGSIRLATTAAAPTVTRTSSTASQSIIPLANVEAHWERLTQEEQLAVHRQLEEVQKKDWKLLSLDEKKAGESRASKQLNACVELRAPISAYFIAFGPHGPRAPIKPPGSNIKIVFGVVGGLVLGATLFATIRSFGRTHKPPHPVSAINAPYLAPPPPKTLTKEWQEASNERALERKQNPITGANTAGRPVSPNLTPLVIGISSEGYKGKGFVTSK